MDLFTNRVKIMKSRKEAPTFEESPKEILRQKLRYKLAIKKIKQYKELENKVEKKNQISLSSLIED